MDNENPTYFSDEFWKHVSQNNVIYPRFKVIEEGLLTYSKIGAKTTFSSQVVEDLILRVLEMGRKQLMDALCRKIDDAILNGIGQASGGDPYPDPPEGFIIGLRHTDAPKLVVSVMGPLTLTTARDAQKGLDFISNNQLAWIVNRAAEILLRQEPEFVSIDRGGPLAKPEPGKIGHLDGVPVFVSDVFPSHDEPRSLCVVTSRWMIDRQKHVAIETDYSPQNDRYHLTVTCLLAFGHIRDMTTPYV